MPAADRVGRVEGIVAITAWNHEEDGSYQAELNGWKLHVAWTPEPPKGGDFGWSWKGEGPAGQKAGSTEFLEEPEIAMMAAEKAATGGEKDADPSGAG